MPKELAAKLEAWASTLETGEADERTAHVVSDGWYQIYRPGSIVSIYHHGQLVSRELIAPKLLDPLGDGSPSLFYSYKLGGKQSMIPHEQVHPLGEDWSYVLWSPETNELRELDFDDASPAVDQSADTHWVKVYRPGTRIEVQHHGVAVEREIVEVKLVKDQESGCGHIEYAYVDGGGYGYVPHPCVQPTGSDWSLVLWNPQSLSFRELDQ